MQQFKDRDAFDIDWDRIDGPWQPMLFQGVAHHVAISEEQEEGGYATYALGTALDHFHIEAVIVTCLVRDDHCLPTVLLHHLDLGE